MGLLRDMVRHDACINVHLCAALGNAARALESSSATGLGVSGLLIPGSPDFPPPLIHWMWVGDEVESACSYVAITVSLLDETLASVGWNILRLIRVSLKERRKSCLPASGFPHALSSPLVLCFCNFCPRAVWMCLCCWQR
jgi:hypothetical protein